MPDELLNRADVELDPDVALLYGDRDAAAQEKARVQQLVASVLDEIKSELQHVMQPDYRGQALRVAFERTLDTQLIMPVQMPNPAAGASYGLIQVPQSAVPDDLTFWELVSAKTKLTTSAVGGNRTPYVDIFDSGSQSNAVNRVERFYTANGIAASAAQLITFSSGIGATTGAINGALPSPAPIALPGWSIGLGSTGLDVADQFSEGYLLVRDWNPAKVAAVIAQFEQRYAAGFDGASRRRYPQ